MRPPSVPTMNPISSRPWELWIIDKLVPPRTYNLPSATLAVMWPFIGNRKFFIGLFHIKILPSLEIVTRLIYLVKEVTDSNSSQIILLIGSLWKYSSASDLLITTPCKSVWPSAMFQMKISPLMVPPAKIKGLLGWNSMHVKQLGTSIVTFGFFGSKSLLKILQRDMLL